MPDNRLAEKVAVVTGAGNGIGKGCAQLFAQQGARVVAIDIDAEALASSATEAQAGGSGRFAATEVCDLIDEAAVQRALAGIGGRFGRIDVLVNAAAFAVFKWIDDMSYADWRHTLCAELDSVFLVTRAAWPSLKRSNAASIVNFASANAYQALQGSPAVAHCAGKGGVLAMTRQLAQEGAPHGIRANTISPGFIETAATKRHLAADPELRGQILAKNMIKRFGTPQDIAWCALWLASNESGYVTGADIRIDGGATAQ